MSWVVLGQMGYLRPKDNLGYQVEGRRLSNNKFIGNPCMSQMSRVVVRITLTYDGNPG